MSATDAFYITLPRVPTTPRVEELVEDENEMEIVPLSTSSAEMTEDQTKSITAFQNFQQTWWQIHKDEDAEDKDVRSAKKFEPMTWRQYVGLGVITAYVIALSIIFKNEPIVAASLTGAVMTSIKISYSQMHDWKSKCAMRTIALITLAAALTLHYIPKDASGILMLLSAIPLSDAAMAVFAKSDLGKLKLDKKLVGLLNRCNLNCGNKLAKVVTTLAQAGAASALMNPSFFGPYISGAGAVLGKAYMRRLVDMAWQWIEKIKDPRSQKIALAVAYSTLIAFASLSTYAATQTELFSQTAWKLLPLVVGIITIDSLIRTGKNAIKSFKATSEEKKEKTITDKVLTVAKTVGVLAAIGGTSYLVGDQMVVAAAGNPGLVVTVCQEAVSFLKVGIKRAVGKKPALGVTIAVPVLAAILFLLRDVLSINRQTPGYGAALFLVPCFIALSLYFMKVFLKAPKKKKDKELKIEEVPLTAMGEETLSKTVPVVTNID